MGVVFYGSTTMKLDLEAARKELKEKSEDAIERGTAIKWAGRAVVCYEKCLEDGSPEMFSRGDDNYHEALEHSALAEDPSLVGEVKAEIGKRRKACIEKFKNKSAFLSLKQTRTVRGGNLP